MQLWLDHNSRSGINHLQWKRCLGKCVTHVVIVISFVGRTRTTLFPNYVIEIEHALPRNTTTCSIILMNWSWHITRAAYVARRKRMQHYNNVYLAIVLGNRVTLDCKARDIWNRRHNVVQPISFQDAQPIVQQLVQLRGASSQVGWDNIAKKFNRQASVKKAYRLSVAREAPSFGKEV